MEKKNTMLLTVIAVATLLVAVVGATFAYFTATSTGDEATVVQVTTESLSSTTATGSGTIKLDVTAEDMVDPGDEDYLLNNDVEKALTISTLNGSTTSDMKCTYTITYTETADTGYTKTANMSEEFYLSFAGTATGTATGATIELDNYDLDGRETNTPNTVSATLTYVVPAVTSEMTTTNNYGGVDWTVGINFVNSASEEQDDNAAMTYAGEVNVTSISCVFE